MSPTTPTTDFAVGRASSPKSCPRAQAIDRREKLRTYLGIPTVLTCLLIDPTALRVEAHVRATQGEAAWTHTLLGIDDEIAIACPPMTLRIRDLFSA